MKEFEFNFYSASASEGRSRTAGLPSGYRLSIWEPTPLRIWPRSFTRRNARSQVVKRRHLLFYYLHHYLRRSRYSIAIVFSGERLAHYSVIRSRDFRFPFMSDDDLQIGPVWTDPLDQRKGIATAVVDYALTTWSTSFKSLWWVCQQDNLASNIVALHGGFMLRGTGVRRRRLAIKALGHFDIADDADPELTDLPDFTVITEAPGIKATSDQLRILYTRYKMAAELAEGKDVLEVACGAGVGLGLIAKHAKRVIAGDIDTTNCKIANTTYRNNATIIIKRFKAENMPFEGASFDLVILFEALYYLDNPDAFFGEVRRVLRPHGTLLLSSVNCKWGGFNRSPYSKKYFDAEALCHTLRAHGFDTQLFAGFSDDEPGGFAIIVRALKKLAVRMRLIPRTMKRKEWLKRIFFGSLKCIPHEIEEGTIDPEVLRAVSSHSDLSRYRMIYAAAHFPNEPKQVIRSS